jgi:hypothetical protein
MTNQPVEPARRNSSAKSGGISATIFLFLFATPFAGFGVFAVIKGIKEVIAGQTVDGLMLCIFGLVFSTVGFGLMFGSIWAWKKSKQTAELQVRNPDKPWLLRADWAAGRIKSSAMTQAKLFLIMALAFCGIGGIVTCLSLPAELNKGNYAVLFVLLFPLVGIAFLVAFMNAWRAQRRFGDCFFEPAQIPIPLGGTLEGMILTGARLKLEQGLHLKFSCIRRTVSGSGDNQRTQENILWQDEKIFKAEASLLDPEPGHSGIPVFFKLPANQPECYTRGDESVFWRLEAKSKMRGPAFSAAFDVPVFSMAGAAVAEEAGEPDPTAALQEPIEELRRDEHSKIQINDGPNGREFYFPAARNLGMAIFLTVFFVIWSGVFWFLVHANAPVMFPIIWGVTDVLVGLGCLNLWLKSCRVTIDSTGVRVTKRWLLLSRSRTFAASDIVRFDTKAGMTSGTTVFQNIKLVTKDSEDGLAAAQERFQQTGQRPPLKFNISSPGGFTLASGIASAPEANWLVQEMMKALGRVQ